MEITRKEEFAITEQEHITINALLNASFGDYSKGRSYYKQLPAFRYLVKEEEKIIGHMAVEHRNINIAETVAPIFGVADLCVSLDFQSRNIASNLLQELEQLGRKSKIEFIVLIAQNHEVYQKNGFELVTNTCRWLMINSNQTLGVGHRRIEECLMVKPIGSLSWKPGLVDFLGHIF